MPRRHQTLPALPAVPATPALPPDAARLWDVLADGYRLPSGGSLLDRATIDGLVDAAAQQFGLEHGDAVRVIRPYLAVFVLRHPSRVLWDAQRTPLLAALQAAANRLA